jgi:hypothetical protein
MGSQCALVDESSDDTCANAMCAHPLNLSLGALIEPAAKFYIIQAVASAAANEVHERVNQSEEG